MRNIRYALELFFFFALAALISAVAHAVSPSPSPIPVSVVPSDPTTLDAFSVQVLGTIGKLGGLSTMLKISAVIMLVIASLKVSVLNKLVWSKLGPVQIWAGPVLGLLAGILGLGAGSVKLSLPLVFAYITAGGGAVFVHEILDLVKAIPGLGPIYVQLISVVEGALGGSQPSQPSQ